MFKLKRSFIMLFIGSLFLFGANAQADNFDLNCPATNQLIYNQANNTWSTTAAVGQYSQIKSSPDASGTVPIFKSAFAELGTNYNAAYKITCLYRLTKGGVLLTARPPKSNLFLLSGHWSPQDLSSCLSSNPTECSFTLTLRHHP
jgi:hypothetical protein